MNTIDWKNLPFGYFKTDYNVRCYYKDGKWGEPEVTDSEQITMHMAATCLHYGQEAFEGLKAFTGRDGKIRIFRLEENAKRMLRSAQGVMMAEVPIELFKEVVLKAVKLNLKYVPPYGEGASLYIRPLLIGTGAQVGVKAAKEYLFMVFVGPVGPYFKEVSILSKCRSYAISTAPPRWEPATSRLAETTQPASVPGNVPIQMAMPPASSSMQRRKNILMKQVPPISSGLKTILMSRPIQPPFCHPSPTCRFGFLPKRWG